MTTPDPVPDLAFGHTWPDQATFAALGVALEQQCGRQVIQNSVAQELKPLAIGQADYLLGVLVPERAVNQRAL